MKIIHLATLLVLLNISSTGYLCGQTVQSGKPVVFDITDGFINEKRILLSEICSAIEYIRLETRPDLFVSRFDIIEIGRTFIVVADTRNFKAFLFSRDGKFIRQLGQIGKGPGEYVEIGSLSLSRDETQVALFDISRHRVILYDTGSTGFRELAIDGNAAEVVFGLDNRLLASYGYPLSLTNNGFQFSWIDSRDKTVQPFARVPESIRSWGNIQVPIHSQDGELLVDQLYNDTIYTLLPGGALKPTWYLRIRKNRMPAESYKRPENLINYSADKARYSKWISSGRWIFLNGSYFNSVRHMIYDRKTLSCVHIPYLKEFHDAVIENDIDGGPPFWFRGTDFSGNPVSLIHPYKILEYQKEGLLSRYPAKEEDAARVFNKLLSEMTENDNPVIQIIKLKR